MSGAQIGGVIGAIIGAYYGGNWQAGYAIGSAIGGAVDPEHIKSPSIGDAQTQTAAAGIPRPIVFGHPAPFRGNLIDGERKARKVTKETQQGKGGGPVVEEEHFLLTYCVRIGEPIDGVLRIWRNEKPIIDFRQLQDIPGWDQPETADAVLQYYNEMKATTAKWLAKVRIYYGAEDQLPDPALEAIHGVGNTPYYRGTSHVVVEDDDVTDVRGAAPVLKFEVTSCTYRGTVVGDVFVTDVNAGGGQGYYQFQNDALAVPGGLSGSYTFPKVNASRTRLYIGEAPTTGVGYVDLDSGLFVPYTAAGFIGGPMGMTSDELYMVVGPGQGHNVYTVSTLTGAIVAHGNDGIALTGVCIPPSSPTAYLCSYLGDIFWTYDIASGGMASYSAFVGSDELRSAGGIAYGNGNFYITCGGGGTTTYIAIMSAFGEMVDFINLSAATGLSSVGGGDIAFSRDGSMFAVTAFSNSVGSVWIFDILGTIIHTVTTTPTSNRSVAFSADGTRLYVAAVNRLYIFDILDNFSLVDSILMSGSGVYGMDVWPPNPLIGSFVPLPDAPDSFIDPDSGTVVSTPEASSTFGACAVSLRYVEEQICARCNVPADAIDFSALDGIDIPGYLISKQFTGADCLIPLMQGFFHDLPEVDGQIKAVLRGGSPIVALTDDDMLDDSEDENTGGQSLEYPLKVTVFTEEPEADYAPVPQTSERYSPDVNAASEYVLRLAIPFGADVAMQIAEKIHNVLWTNAEASRKHCLPREHGRLIVSDTFTKDDRRWLIQRAEKYDGELKVDVVYDRIKNYESNASGNAPQLPTPATTGLFGPTKFAWLNLPVLTDADDKIGFYVAVGRTLSGWNGAVVFASIDFGETWVEFATITSSSVIGSLVTALPDAGEEAIDRTNVVRVKVNGTLDSITELQFLQERNACVIGDELCQFQTATLISTGVYELSILARGRLDTATASHAVGDRFVLLNAPVFCEVPASWIGLTVTMRAASIGTVEDANPVETHVFTPCRSQTEWAPFMFDGERDGSNNVAIAWNGRARLGSNVNPIHSTNFIGYRVSITKGGTTVVKTPTFNQFYSYSATEQTADFGSATGTLTVAIAAMNRITGPSAELTGSIP